MLSALAAIDGILILNGARLGNEILKFQPEIYVKSGNCTIEKLETSEREAFQTANAAIRFIPFVENINSTSIMKNFRNNFYFCIANSQRFIAK
jgi:D-beta-D-heptose 7-phosphate kinase/D-beta-D-heptose 1-phosphate adenosyltransferase